MTWNDILISVVSLILTGLASWAVATFTAWMNEKLKGKKSQKYANEALAIVTACVKSTYQTYVEALKGTDLWTKEAQQTAFNMAFNSAREQLSNNVINYITTEYGDIDVYITGLIESVLYDLKKN